MKLDFLVYSGLLGAILFVGSSWRDESYAPPPPPPLTPTEVSLFSAFTPFTPGSLISVQKIDNPAMTGTAFSVGQGGQWIVSRQSLKDCPNPYLAIGGNLGVRFKIRKSADLANYQMGITSGGARPLPLAPVADLKPGTRGFMPGYLNDSVGEATGRLIGPTLYRKSKRFQKDEQVLAWAESGHTYGINGSLNRLQGGPTLNSASQVIGITLRHNPRRGRIYSSTPQTLAHIARPPERRDDFEHEDTFTRKNYGIVSDTVRRQYRVMQVACLQS
jgi:serine protease Do